MELFIYSLMWTNVHNLFPQVQIMISIKGLNWNEVNLQNVLEKEILISVELFAIYRDNQDIRLVNVFMKKL